jgi:hypothetical protein
MSVNEESMNELQTHYKFFKMTQRFGGDFQNHTYIDVDIKNKQYCEIYLSKKHTRKDKEICNQEYPPQYDGFDE